MSLYQRFHYLLLFIDNIKGYIHRLSRRRKTTDSWVDFYQHCTKYIVLNAGHWLSPPPPLSLSLFSQINPPPPLLTLSLSFHGLPPPPPSLSLFTDYPPPPPLLSLSFHCLPPKVLLYSVAKIYTFIQLIKLRCEKFSWVTHCWPNMLTNGCMKCC